MRVISGKAKSIKLKTIEGDSTRPTTDRIKETLFNMISSDIYDSNFLYLFSVSGAIGIEALSRGAKKSILCDKSKEAIQIINKNIEKTHFEKDAEVYNLDFKSCLKNIKDPIDIIYIDPPYQTDYIKQSLEIIQNIQFISKDTLIILETDDEEKVLQQINDLKFEIIDKRKYGIAHIIFLQKRTWNKKGGMSD